MRFIPRSIMPCVVAAAAFLGGGGAASAATYEFDWTFTPNGITTGEFSAFSIQLAASGTLTITASGPSASYPITSLTGTYSGTVLGSPFSANVSGPLSTVGESNLLLSVPPNPTEIDALGIGFSASNLVDQQFVIYFDASAGTDAIADFGIPGGNLGVEYGTFDVTLVTPIPGAMPLFATGLGALGLLGWRRKRKAQG